MLDITEVSYLLLVAVTECTFQECSLAMSDEQMQHQRLHEAFLPFIQHEPAH